MEEDVKIGCLVDTGSNIMILLLWEYEWTLRLKTSVGAMHGEVITGWQRTVESSGHYTMRIGVGSFSF